MKIHFFPTVWTDTILLEKDGHFGLVDACINMEKIGKYFAEVGVEKLDFIILTHFHKDHYGSIADMVKTYPVEQVIFKDFSGVVGWTSTGTRADDAYRADETRICNELKKTVKEHSKLVMSDEVEGLLWMGIPLKFFYNTNILKEIYEDENSPWYNKCVTTENRNNMAIFFEYAGRNVLLSGDIADTAADDERVGFLNNKMAKSLNCKLDIYKVAHHGYGIGIEDTLKIYCPDYAVITNKVENSGAAVEQLTAVNPDMNIYIMSNGGKVFDIASNGDMTVSDLQWYD